MGSTPAPGVAGRALASSALARGISQKRRGSSLRPMSSARARKTAREARALPLPRQRESQFRSGLRLEIRRRLPEVQSRQGRSRIAQRFIAGTTVHKSIQAPSGRKRSLSNSAIISSVPGGTRSPVTWNPSVETLGYGPSSGRADEGLQQRAQHHRLVLAWQPFEILVIQISGQQFVLADATQLLQMLPHPPNHGGGVATEQLPPQQDEAAKVLALDHAAPASSVSTARSSWSANRLNSPDWSRVPNCSLARRRTDELAS